MLGRFKLVCCIKRVWIFPRNPVLPIRLPYDLSIILWKSSCRFWRGCPKTFISSVLLSGIYFLYFLKFLEVDRTPWCFCFSSVFVISDSCLFLLDESYYCSPDRFEVVFSRRDVPNTYIYCSSFPACFLLFGGVGLSQFATASPIAFPTISTASYLLFFLLNVCWPTYPRGVDAGKTLLWKEWKLDPLELTSNNLGGSGFFSPRSIVLFVSGFYRE